MSMAAQQRSTHSPFSKFVKNPELIVRDATFSEKPLQSSESNRRSRRLTKSVISYQPSESVGKELEELLSQPTEDVDKIKELLRFGYLPVNDPYRAQLWKRLTDRMTKPFSRYEVYMNGIKNAFGDEAGNQDISLVKAYATPSFDDDIYHNHRYLTTDGLDALHRILAVISYERPDITYCPVLSPFIAILLHYMSEDEAYGCATAILTQKVPLYYITQTKRSYFVLSFVFQTIAKKYCKSSCAFMESKAINDNDVYDDWVFWIFDFLPFYHLVRVMDCFLYEGPKVLFRIGMALLELYHKAYQDIPRKTVITMSIQDFCSSIGMETLMLFKVGFAFKDLSKSSLKKLEMKADTLAMASKPKLGVKKAGSIEFIVSTKTNSTIMTRNEWRIIYSWLPTRIALMKPRMVFSSDDHGSSMRTFYNKIETLDQTLIVIFTKFGDLIGAYISGKWIERRVPGGNGNKYFGTGESFVFRMLPKPSQMFGWVGLNEGRMSILSTTEEGKRKLRRASLFATGDNTMIAIGGGISGQAIYIHEGMSMVSSSPCDTFTNPCLLSKGDIHPISVLEVFGFMTQLSSPH